jgi:hypothetical protein
VLKNLAHLNGLKAIQFAVVFYEQGAIYLHKKSMIKTHGINIKKSPNGLQ